jgi:diguanylate cyclase (GGDEF)-like protein
LHCDSLATGRTLDLNDRAYFRQARASSDPAFEAVFGRLTGIAVLQVAFPARDSRGELKYILLASLNLAQFNARIATASPHPGMEAVIWDAKGTVMALHPDDGPKKLAGSSQADSALYRFVRSEQSGDTAELAGPDGRLKIWARSVSPVAAGSGLRIALGIPRDVLLANADQNLRRALSILGIGSLLAFLAALLFAELGIRRPVARVMTAAERQRAGDVGARIGAPYPQGELGDLMATLDATAASVQSQQVDIERKSEELRRKNRTLRMLSGINTLIVRVPDRDELFREACRIAVEHGQFKMAWIGVADRSAMKIVPVASAGAEPEFLTLVKDRFSLREDAPLGNTISARAIREKKAIVSNEIRGDAKILFAEDRTARGISSMAILPLLVSDEAVGVLALYAGEAGFFDEEEMKLLTELAGDIAFAIDHIEKQQRLDYLAYYDALTGLANRNLFHERLVQYIESARSDGQKLAVLVVDVDRFKNINDTFGRQAGDELLKQVAVRIERHAGPIRMARLNVDNFAIVRSDVGSESEIAQLVEQWLAECFGPPYVVSGTELRVSAKAGIALFPNDGADADALFRNAETALKKAKASGERYLFHTQQMTETVAGKLTLENQLRQAIDKEEFVLHYQPKVDLVSGKLRGAEALIRWNDPLTGLVPPGKFIPVLEETGLIFEVGRWALRRAVADYLRWRAAGLPAVRVAVNVSPLQLRNRGFVAEIEQVIGIDPDAAAGLELEITESLIMEDVKHNIASLRAIRALGVTIAIDDFGTGFSSLSYLAKLPVDTLKIDRSFVIDMTAGPQGLALVSTIINLAHSLKLKVVAEGVETEEQSRLLRLLNCDEMQGFLFSKPVPSEIFETRFLAPASRQVAEIELINPR